MLVIKSIKTISEYINIDEYYLCGSNIELILEDNSKHYVMFYRFGDVIHDNTITFDNNDRGCVICEFKNIKYPKDGIIEDIYYTKEQFEYIQELFSNLFDNYGECKDCN